MSNAIPRRIPENVKQFIIAKKQQKVPVKKIIEDIFEKFQRPITYTTIQRVWEKFEIFKTTADLPRSGRPKTLDVREERTLVREFLTKPGISVNSYVADQTRAGKRISRRTVSRTLRRNKVVPRVSNRGKEISYKNLKKRVQWAKMVRHWTISEWRSIVFTDECLLYPKRTVGRVIWHRQGAPCRHEAEPNLHYKAIKVLGFICYNGNRGLVRYEGNMRAKNYKELLERHLRDAVPQEEDPAYEFIFMHDGAKYHKAKKVTDFLHDNVDVISWPPQSPDINIIENVWASLRNELWLRRSEIINANDVWRISREIFYHFTLVYFHSLYNSIPERIEKIIKAKGSKINRR